MDKQAVVPCEDKHPINEAVSGNVHFMLMKLELDVVQVSCLWSSGVVLVCYGVRRKEAWFHHQLPSSWKSFRPLYACQLLCIYVKLLQLRI